MDNLTIIIDSYPCLVCQRDTVQVYVDSEEKLICLKCRKQGRETEVKLVNPGVVIGRYIQN